MRKFGKALLVILVGVMFPTVFVLLVVAALHILDKTPMNIFTIPLAFTLWGITWFIYRKLERHDYE